MPILDVAERLGVLAGLRRAGREHVGPCPACGGRDRFGINPDKNLFLCRRCGGKGGQIDLVRHVLALDFKGALAWLCGERDAALDPVEAARRKRRAAEARDRAEREAARFRARAIEAAQDIWASAVPAAGTPVEDYLRLRRVHPGVLPAAFRYIADHPYIRRIGGASRELHRGPAMIAAVTAPAPGGGVALRCVHQTWIDLSQPGGKARIPDPEGDGFMPAKITRGAKRGGAIRMIFGTNGHLIMGEGIETTLTAAVAGVDPDASFWSGVDLGNMAGRTRRVPGVRYSAVPDMEDAEAFVPPPQITRLTFIQDGDCHPAKTHSLLLCGLRRAMALRPGLSAAIAPAREGADLNDMIMEAS